MLKIENLNKTFYPGTPEEHRIFKDFSLEIEANVCTTILGPNGCGKSTLFNLISGSIESDSGSINLNGNEINKLPEEKRASYIGKVNQDPSKGVSPSLNILENMSIALKKGEKFTFKKLIKNNNVNMIVEKLKELDLGLEDKLTTQVKFLSGGQRQSLSLLMSTIKRPDLLLLDEHTAALDPKTSKLIMDKTVDLINREKITTLMITHNLRHAIQYSKRIIMLNKGEIVLDVQSEDITEDELTKFYNERILESLKLVS
ncbi:ABC transporter ATP-binding protein [Anaerosphaera multitolerans]|uniref:ATP-binding cassette domain-containing protein n=1 Tax=Anaerosphaera multitolerans TaxID=2487351 RepID=A0A437S7E1_9FIRM|nr:ATP-binding cassette domain-containing protein [Anaerosphaera multitolerans]RVU54989.1 ATP-binding cassette domain-containing protein [Anaerosphaera multitolerans]